MKPILYESTETLFQSNGLGVLSDCISAHVVEERNGQYEAEFEYPVDGIHYSDIIEGRIILCSHDESGDLQPFDIYGHSKTINGVTRFFAHHISYRQLGITVKPFTATSLTETLTKLKANSVNYNPFNYSTDKSVSASFTLASPKSLKSILGGEEGSLLDVYGAGEYEWDRFQVILHLHRGSDSGVVVRYGKNLLSLQDDIDYSDSYNGIVPFWYGENQPTDGTEAVETLVTLPEWAIYKSGSTYDGRNTIIPVDFSSQFQTPPTVAQLRSAAQSYLDKGNPMLPTDTLTFDFVELSKTEEYSFLELQQVNLCDTVRVIFDDIDAVMKVVSVDWDVLKERYNSVTLGDAPATYAQVITDRLATIANEANVGAKLAKLWATNALSIAGNTNQYFWFAGTGTDTGAHITEVPRETFLADPTNGGGNLLARSNGIAVRDGLTELATFGANGARIGESDKSHVELDYRSFQLKDAQQNAYVHFSDLRDDTGYYTASEKTMVGTNWTGLFQTAFEISSIISVTADNSPITNYAKTGAFYIRITDSLPTGTVVGVTYTTFSDQAKAFTIGSRRNFGAIGGMSVAFGNGVVAGGFASVAEGENTTASGRGSHAEGYATTASAVASHSEGNSTTASGFYSHAQNSHTIAQGYSQTVIGEYNVASGYNGIRLDANYAFIIGNGRSDTNRSNAFTIDWIGNVDIPSGASYKINGSPLSASDITNSITGVKGNEESSYRTGDVNITPANVGAVPNSNGTISSVKPYGSANTKIGVIGTNSNDSTSYLFQATSVAPALYDNTNGTTLWTGYTTLNKPSASDVGALPISGGTLTGNLYVNGSVNVKNASGINSYNGSDTLRTLAFISSTNIYFYGSGSYDNSEGSAYYEGNAVNIRSKGAVNITAPSNVNVTGSVKLDAGYTFDARTNKSSSTTGGWANSRFRFLDADGTAIGWLGMLGNQDTITYMYLGMNAYNGNNLRIYDDGHIWANGIVNNGTYDALYKITTVEVTASSGIPAHSYVSTASQTMTAQTGYNAVGVVGWSSTNYRISPFTAYVASNTSLQVGLVNTSATAVTTSVTVTLRVLWLKATSA